MRLINQYLCYLSLPVLLVWLHNVHLSGQPQNMNAPQEDLQPYLSFFYFHDDFSTWADARLAKNAVDNPEFLRGVAKHLRVDVADLARIAAVSHSVGIRLRSLSAETAAYMDKISKNKQNPDITLLQEFESRRQQILQSGISQLMQGLSPQSWSGLHTHITIDRKRHMRYFVGKIAPPPGTTR